MNRKFAAIFAVLIFTAPMAWAQHTITTVAGGGPSSVPLSAAIYNPDAVFKDASGNLYIAATGANAIYKIDSTGKLTTAAGTGTAGFRRGRTGDLRTTRWPDRCIRRWSREHLH